MTDAFQPGTHSGGIPSSYNPPPVSAPSYKSPTEEVKSNAASDLKWKQQMEYEAVQQQDRIKAAHREEMEKKKELEKEEQQEKDDARDKLMEESIMALPEEPAEGDGVCTI